MQNQYYLKDKKAQIYKVTHSQEPGGFPAVNGYYPRCPSPMWCYTRQLSQEQVFAAAAWGESETRLFVFNYYTGIDLYNVISYKGKWYEITRVDTTDDYNGDLFIYVKKTSAAKEELIKEYDPTKWE